MHLPWIVARLCTCILLFTAALFAQVPETYFSPLQWRLVGPFRAGRTIAATGIPGKPNTYIFGSVDGGLWQTDNAGVTWRPITDDEPFASIGAIAVAPSKPETIYVGTGESDIRSNLASGDGVWRSDDGGKTWRNIGLRETRQISRVVVDPTDPNVVFVAALGHAYGANQERGVFKSTDGGNTWEQVLFKDQQTGAADLAIARSKPNILFATMWSSARPPWSAYAPIDGDGSGLYRSTDGGDTWTELRGHGLPSGQWSRSGVTCSPDGQRVYALIAVNAPNNPTSAQRAAVANASGLYRSDDGGATWQLMNSDPRLTSRAWYFNWPMIDPANPGIVYVPNVALYRSEDGGKTMDIVRGAPGGDDYHDIWIDPANTSRMILAVDQGASISVDRGATWSSWYNQPTGQMYHVTTDNKFPYNIYGAEQDSGAISVASRSDRGVLSAQDWRPLAGSESGYFVIDPKDENIVYSTGSYGSVQRMDRRTMLSQDISPWPMPVWSMPTEKRMYRAPWTPMLTMSKVDGALYLGTQYVMRTRDGGLHWEKISDDLTGAGKGNIGISPNAEPTADTAAYKGYGVVYAIAPSPLKANTIWAGTDTGYLYLTNDGGKAWAEVTPKGLAPWSRMSMIEASRFDAGTAYAAIDRHRMNDLRPYMVRTRDGGKTWQPITTGIPHDAFVRAIREDVVQRGLLFAGTERGIYFSADDGDHWQSLQRNLPMSAIYDIAVHENDVIAATHGRAFWVMDDIEPLREAASIRPDDSAHLFTPVVAVRVDNDAFLGTPLPPEEPHAKNPPGGAIIDYFLRSDAHEVTLEVLTHQGELVRRYSSAEPQSSTRTKLPIAERWFPKPQKLEANAGMHRFVWDLRWATSGVALDDNFDEAAPPKGPRVTPGTYTVKLSVDGKAISKPFGIKMDPRSAAAQQVLAQQEQLGREIYAQTLLSRKAVSEAGTVRKQLQAVAVPSADVKQFLAELNKILKGSDELFGLDDANAGLLAALRVVEGGNREVPAAALEVYRQSRTALEQRSAEWQNLKSRVPRVNSELKQSGTPGIAMKEIEEEIGAMSRW